MPGTGIAALHDLRRTRRRNRLADLEWFEAAYRVYLVAIVSGAAVLYLSDLVGDDDLTSSESADLLRHGPAVLGIAVALALAWGARSGSHGGPIALERADVSHVLTAPVSRRRAMVRPAVQSMRWAAFVTGMAGAVAGQLAGRRAPGSVLSWTCAGAAFGAVLGLLAVSVAIVTHAMRVPRWAATAAGTVVIAAQSAAAATQAPSPANLLGSLALWGWRQRAVDLIAVAGVVSIAVAALGALERISLESLGRRSSLVAQLRFAVTMQDLRTVVLLRRQLGQERTRARPWFRLPRSGRSPAVWRRGWHSLLRFPASRLARAATLAGVAAACQVAAFEGTTPAIVGSGLALFVLGLDVLEPLSQEVDQADRTDSYPVARGVLLSRHLVAPAAALVPFAVVGLGVAAAIRPEPSTLAMGAIMCVPVALAGAAGAVVSVVMDAPDPVSTNAQQAMLPPEIGGLATTLRLAIPLAVSVLAGVPVLVVRHAAQQGGSVTGAAVRGALGLVLLIAATAAWVRVRDDVRRALRRFFAEGRAARTRQHA